MPKSKETPTDHLSYAVLIPPSPVYGDNLGSIFTSNNPETPGKNKHLDVRFFKHRDYAKSGKIRVKAGVKVRGVQKISLISCARLLVATGPPGTRRALLMAADPAPRRARSMRARGSEISAA